MEQYEINEYSHCLNRDMKIAVYGHYGLPILCFPCQNGDCYDLQAGGMIDTLSDYIEQGKIKLFCVSSVDRESWSDLNGDKSHRTWMQEQFYYYIINEVLPLIYESCGGFIKPYCFGCSMGANHSAIFALRRPDLFAGIIALSSVIDDAYFFQGWCDERLYNNSPLRFIKNLPYDHHYIEMYNSMNLIFCCGQGAWEEGLSSLLQLKHDFEEKNIHAWVDIWGKDVAHDWPWWKIEIRYFLDKIL